MRSPGTAICITSSRPIQATPQYFRPPLFQRLLCRLLPLVVDILLPEKIMGTRCDCILLGTRHQDVTSPSFASCGNHIISRSRIGAELASCASDGPDPSSDSHTILADQRMGISRASIRVL
jgi:hypothetical protein